MIILNFIKCPRVLTQIRTGHTTPPASASWRTSRVDAASVRHQSPPPRVPCTGSPGSDSVPFPEMKSAPRFYSATCLMIQEPGNNRQVQYISWGILTPSVWDYDYDVTRSINSMHFNSQIYKKWQHCCKVTHFTSSWVLLNRSFISPLDTSKELFTIGNKREANYLREYSLFDLLLLCLPKPNWGKYMGFGGKVAWV